MSALYIMCNVLCVYTFINVLYVYLLVEICSLAAYVVYLLHISFIKCVNKFYILLHFILIKKIRKIKNDYYLIMFRELEDLQRLQFLSPVLQNRPNYKLKYFTNGDATAAK